MMPPHPKKREVNLLRCQLMDVRDTDSGLSALAQRAEKMLGLLLDEAEEATLASEAQKSSTTD
jgi:hypothetical protein